MSTSNSSKRKRTTTSSTCNKRSKPSHECAICYEQTTSPILLPCNHQICKPCLTSLINTAIELRRKPSCCSIDLDVQALGRNIPAAIQRLLLAREVEYQAENPLFCANGKCGNFLTDLAESPPFQHDEDVKTDGIDRGRSSGLVPCTTSSNSFHTNRSSSSTFLTLNTRKVNGKDLNSPAFQTCKKCRKATCLDSVCRSLKADHIGIYNVCPGWVDDQDIKKMMKGKDWKRCPKCVVMTEKTSGCDHMRCRCRAEWCYRCAKICKGATHECMRVEFEPVGEAEIADIGPPFRVPILRFGQDSRERPDAPQELVEQMGRGEACIFEDPLGLEIDELPEPAFATREEVNRLRERPTIVPNEGHFGLDEPDIEEPLAVHEPQVNVPVVIDISDDEEPVSIQLNRTPASRQRGTSTDLIILDD